MAEIAAQYIRKGKLILVKGKVEASAFTGKDGEARATLELTANNFKFLGGRRDNGEGEGETGPSVPVVAPTRSEENWRSPSDSAKAQPALYPAKLSAPYRRRCDRGRQGAPAAASVRIG